MELRILTAEDRVRYHDRILEMMKESDKDFVPPLSTRFSPKQTVFTGGEGTEEGLITYMQSMMKETMLAAFEGDLLLGFITFVENMTTDYFGEDTLPNIYLCTLVVSRAARGKNLTRTLYSHLFYERYAERSIFTRTWSTNGAHIHILDGYGFSELHRKPDDRGPGIDTVYFSLRRK